jgi:hypothetical protein
MRKKIVKLEKGGCTPHPLHPTCNTLKIHLSTPCRCGVARGLTDTTGGHVPMESTKKTLAISLSTPAVRHARPWCPPEGGSHAAVTVVDVTDPRRNSAPRQWSDSSIRDPQQFSGVFWSHALPAPTGMMCLSYPNCETGHRLVRGVYALITALGLGFNRVLRLSSSLMPLIFFPWFYHYPR